MASTHIPGGFHVKTGETYVVKELFKELAQAIRTHFRGQTGQLDILDAGCASGELPHFLQRELATSGSVRGFDISSALVESAKDRFGGYNIDYFIDDIATFKLDAPVDVLTATSVLSYFTDPTPVLRNLLMHLKPGGIALISGVYNDWNIDVEMKFRFDASDWSEHQVINQFSKARMRGLVSALGYTCEFTPQTMPFDIPPSPAAPIRSWTVSLDGERHMMNALQIVYNIEILRITHS
jgi:SAM-dependent methyltransferase